MKAADGLGGALALLSPLNLRLCFVTRPNALGLEPLEAALLREAGEGSEGGAAPSPILRPSILNGAFVRVRCDDSYHLDRIAGTQLAAGGRVVVRLQAAGRCVALTSLSRSHPFEDDAGAWQRLEGWQQELAALHGALAEAPPTCWEIASACCRLSTAWRWAQRPPKFAAAMQHGLPSLAAQLENAAAVEAVLSCVEPASQAAASDRSAAAAAEQFMASFAVQSAAVPAVQSAAVPAAQAAVPPITGPAAAISPAVRPPAHLASLAAAMPAGPACERAAAPQAAMSPIYGPAAATATAVCTPVQLASLTAAPLAGPAYEGAAAVAAAAGCWEAPGGSGQWVAPSEQHQRIVTVQPDQQQRPKRDREDRDSPPGKRPRSQASPGAPGPADRYAHSTPSEWKLRRIEAAVPPGSDREALLVRAVNKSCPPGQERQGGDLGSALSALNSGWKALLGGHSLTDLLLAMGRRGLVRAEVRRDPNSKVSGRNVYYSRAAASRPRTAARPSPRQAAERPVAPAAQAASNPQLSADLPPGSQREALLKRAVAELDSKQPGQAHQTAKLGEQLLKLDSGWKKKLGGHRLNDLVWELHRRGLVRVEERTTPAGYRNLFVANLRC